MANSEAPSLAQRLAEQSLVPLKAMLPEYRADVLLGAQVQQVYAGQRLFEQGVFDNKHIYLLAGCVELQFSSGLMIKVLQSDALAHYPLAHIQPRNCRALAASDCTILRIDSIELDRLLTCSQVLQHGEHELEKQLKQSPLPNWMRTVLHSALFRQVPAVNVERILRSMTEVKVCAGQTLITQGEAGNCCYFMREGTATLTRNTAGLVNFVADVQPGMCFAQETLLSDSVHSGSVTMCEDGIVLRLERDAFFLLQLNPAIEQWGYPRYVREQQIITAANTPWLIDVRTEDEYLQGHVPGAISLPLARLYEALPYFDSLKYCVFCCDTGRRSHAAANLLGPKLQVAILAGGINDDAWRPIVSTLEPRCFSAGGVKRLVASASP